MGTEAFDSFYPHGNKQEYVLLRLFVLLGQRISLVLSAFLRDEYCRIIKPRTAGCQGFLGERNYTMKFNTMTCRTLKQAYHFLELKLFRIKYPPSDVCFTVHVILKFSVNTELFSNSPSLITGFRGLKDFFF